MMSFDEDTFGDKSGDIIASYSRYLVWSELVG